MAGGRCAGKGVANMSTEPSGPERGAAHRAHGAKGQEGGLAAVVVRLVTFVPPPTSALPTGPIQRSSLKSRAAAACHRWGDGPAVWPPPTAGAVRFGELRNRRGNDGVQVLPPPNTDSHGPRIPCCRAGANQNRTPLWAPRLWTGWSAAAAPAAAPRPATPRLPSGRGWWCWTSATRPRTSRRGRRRRQPRQAWGPSSSSSDMTKAALCP